MIHDDEIKRINELARKKKTTGLSADEQSEQSALREKYLQAIRTSMKRSLDNIEFVDKD